MRKILSIGTRLFAVVTVLFVVAGCGTTASGDGSEVFSVVVTTSIHGDIVRSALGDAVPDVITVDVIMPPGADPHEFSASAKQAEQMENADLLVMNGLDLEAGLDGIIDAVADTGTPIFRFADHLDAVRAADELDDHGGADPHLWTDPAGLVPIVEALRDELIAAGIDAAAITGAIDEYVVQLEATDDAIEATLASIPDDQRVLVTNHDAFGYFAARYGFEIVGTVIPSLTTSAEASPAALDDLAAEMKERSVRAVFAENTESDRLASALADEVGDGVIVVELLSGSLGPSGSGADTYLTMMTTNADLIAAALSP